MYLLLHEEQLLLCVDDDSSLSFGEVCELFAEPPVLAHEILESIFCHF